MMQVIESKWIDGWYEWRTKSSTSKVLMILPRILLLPIIAIWLIIAPNTKRGRKWQAPVNRYISAVASYLVFLFFVFKESTIEKREQLRGAPDTGK